MSEKEEKPPVEQPAAAAEAATEEKKEKKKGPTKEEKKAERLRARLAEQEAADRAKAEEMKKFADTFGAAELVQSKTTGTKKFVALADLSADHVDTTVLIRARIHQTRKQGGKMCFVILRECGVTVQGVLNVNDGLPPLMIGFTASIPNESVVDVIATVTKPETPVESTTLKTFELVVKKIHVVSEAMKVLPFQLADASRKAGDATDSKAAVAVNQDTRLNNRWLDLRTPASNAIFRVQSRVCQYFREFLTSQDFVEIHTPKIIGTASEGGAGVFKLGYFGKDAYLAQSPQLYKQMVVQGDLPKVFEIGSVFRAENANTHRHLTEFIGLDIEMAIHEHYYEVLDVAESLFAFMFGKLGQMPELAAINEQHPFDPFVYQVSDETVKELGIGIIAEGIEPTDEFQARIHNRDTKVIRMPLPMGIRFLNKNSPEEKQIPEDEDLDTESEKRLGVLMKQRYGVDFYIFDRFPFSARPFYTMPCPEDDKFTNSFDMFMRGEEISSGAQRIHDPQLLLANAQKKGVDMTPMKDYVDSFRLGAWPHGGFGVGMERVVMLYLGLKNVRFASLFPRDPARTTP